MNLTRFSTRYLQIVASNPLENPNIRRAAREILADRK